MSWQDLDWPEVPGLPIPLPTTSIPPKSTIPDIKRVVHTAYNKKNFWGKVIGPTEEQLHQLAVFEVYKAWQDRERSLYLSRLNQEDRMYLSVITALEEDHLSVLLTTSLDQLPFLEAQINRIGNGKFPPGAVMVQIMRYQKTKGTAYFSDHVLKQIDKMF
jgi:hypothetical protein